jgi:two-component system cell cycle response regulator CtrA
MMLRSESYVCDTTDMGEDGLEIGKLYDYDIIVLDLMLPDIDGYEVLRRLRAARVQTPILILSGLSGLDDKIKGLGVGADDYLTKPFDKRELIARIQAIVRRSKGHPDSIIQTGKLKVNLDARTVEVDGQPLHLTGKEYGILELLSLRKGTTLTKEMFLNHLYGGMDEPELKIIDVFVCKLRKKLSSATGGENYLVGDRRRELYRDRLGPRLRAARPGARRRRKTRDGAPGGHRLSPPLSSRAMERPGGKIGPARCQGAPVLFLAWANARLRTKSPVSEIRNSLNFTLPCEP